MSSTKIILQDVELEVTFSYTPGSEGSWDEPPYPSELDIEEVFCAGVDIIELLSVKQITAIVEAIETKGPEIPDPTDLPEKEYCHPLN
jgi:hypothetical protein